MATKKRSERSSTPVKISTLQSRVLKTRQKAFHCVGPKLSPVSETKGHQESVVKPHKRRLEDQSSSLRVTHSKITSTPSTEEPSQDSTSMIMPSGVSSFLLDCMDSDSEVEDTPPSIETFCKADIYDDGTCLPSEDEMLHQYIKNSTLLDLSCAKDLAMQQSPNLSLLGLQISPITHVQAGESSSLSPPQPAPNTGSSPWTGPCDNMSTFKNTSGCEMRPAVEKTPATEKSVLLSPVVKRRPSTNRHRLIKCKKVTFNDIVSTRDITVLNPSEKTSGARRRLYNDVHEHDDTERRGKTSSRTRAEPSDPQRPTATARFFDFANESEKEAFFQRLKRSSNFMFPAKLITFADEQPAEDMLLEI